MVGYREIIGYKCMTFSGAFRAFTQINELSGVQKGYVSGAIIPVPNVTLTYTLIATNVTQDQTTTVSGASINDFVLVGAPALVAGLGVTAFVSAANTVTVRLDNATAGGITPGALVFNILVIKP